MATPQTLATLTLTLTLGMGLGLAGCSPENTDGPHDPLTSPTSPTAEPTEENTDADTEPLGPVKTVRAWVDAMGYVQATGDRAAIDALSTHDCDSCDGLIQPFVDVYSNGGRVESEGWSVVSARRSPTFDDDHTVGAVIDYGAGQTWPSEGDDPVSYEAEQELITFELRKVEQTWLVSAVVYPS